MIECTSIDCNFIECSSAERKSIETIYYQRKKELILNRAKRY